MSDSDPRDDIHLVLPAVATSVATARVAVGNLAERVGLDPQRVRDVRLAVTEAMANAVRHAYPDGVSGEVVVQARAAAGALDVLVRDRGRGVATATRSGTADGLGIGMGLPLMRTLADRATVDETDGGGCTLRLRFDFVSAGDAARTSESARERTS